MSSALVRARSFSVPAKRERLVGFVHRNKRCWTRLDERWNRRLSDNEQSSHNSIGSFIKRREVRDSGGGTLMHGLYCDDQPKDKEMS